MAHKYVPHTFRTGEVIEPTRVNENARTLANEFNGNLDRENLRENCITASDIAIQTCNLIGNRTNVKRTTAQLFPNRGTLFGVRQMSFKTFMSGDFNIKTDALLIASYSFNFEWVHGEAVNQYNSSANLGDILVTSVTDRHRCIFTLRINGIEISRSANHNIFRKNDSVYLSGAHPVSAGPITVDCQMKIIDSTTASEYLIVADNDILNFKFKKR